MAAAPSGRAVPAPSPASLRSGWSATTLTCMPESWVPLPLTVVPIPGPGAEDVLVADDGRVWTGTADGGLHVHDPETRTTTTVAATP